jgi:hypothetical protein
MLNLTSADMIMHGSKNHLCWLHRSSALIEKVEHLPCDTSGQKWTFVSTFNKSRINLVITHK